MTTMMGSGIKSNRFDYYYYVAAALVVVIFFTNKKGDRSVAVHFNDIKRRD